MDKNVDIDLILTTCRNNQQWSACLWDYLTGNALRYYKSGGSVAPKTLNLIGNDYILCADENKPLTHIWQVISQEPDKKLGTILSEKVQVMTICPNSCYLAAGIGVKLYVWFLPSGNLLTIQKKNFQPITCIKFSSDGHFLIVGGQDGLLLVYKLVTLVSLHNNLASQSDGQVETVFTKNDHSLPITDIHVGCFKDKARFATVSIDNTCKIYSLASGNLLLNLVFEEPLTAVIFDGPCWNLYVGRNSGKIQQFLIKNPPKNKEEHVNAELEYSGHKNRVTCLDLSLSSNVLASGSEDNFVYLWDVETRQILKRIEHKGAITNVKFVLKHENFFTQNLKVSTVVKNLDRNLIQNENFIISKIQNYDLEDSDDEKDGNSEEVKILKVENTKLRSANKELYEVAMKICQKYNKIK